MLYHGNLTVVPSWYGSHHLSFQISCTGKRPKGKRQKLGGVKFVFQDVGCLRFSCDSHKPIIVRSPGRYYSQSKLTSYQRQLSLYGFVRITSGKDRGAYYHEYFLRGRPDLLVCIDRKRIKGTGGKLSASPPSEPDFYTMNFCFESHCETEVPDDQDNDEGIEVGEEPTTTMSSECCEVPSSTKIEENIQDVASVVSDDESLEAFVASVCNEVSSVLPGNKSNVICKAPDATNLSIQRSMEDACEAEMLAEFGQDLFDDEKVSSSSTPPTGCVHVIASLVVDRGPSVAIKTSTKVGPLRVPGQLRNSFGSGIRSTCVHSTLGTPSGSVVKYIPMDSVMCANWKDADEEHERFRKPLDKAIVFHALDHVNWEHCEAAAESFSVPLSPDFSKLEDAAVSGTSIDLVHPVSSENEISSSECSVSSGEQSTGGDADLKGETVGVSN